MSEVSSVTSDSVVEPVVDTPVEKPEEKKVDTVATGEEQPSMKQAEVKSEKLVQDVQLKEDIKKIANKAPKKVIAPPSQPKPALPPLELKKISIKDLKKMDAALVKAHAKDDKAVHSSKWDAGRQVVVIEKSGTFRVYKIGEGSHPAIFDSGKESKVKAFLNNM